MKNVYYIRRMALCGINCCALFFSYIVVFEVLNSCTPLIQPCLYLTELKLLFTKKKKKIWTKIKGHLSCFFKMEVCILLLTLLFFHQKKSFILFDLNNPKMLYMMICHAQFLLCISSYYNDEFSFCYYDLFSNSFSYRL